MNDRLVWRTFHEQLNLAVLVGCSESPKRSWAEALVARAAMLSQALGPQLDEPVGNVPKRIGVRHQDLDMAAQLRVRQILKRREDSGRILRQDVVSAAERDVVGAGQELRRVHPSQRRGQHSHRCEHAESPANRRRNVEHRNAVALGDFAERALGRISDENEVALHVAHASLEPLTHDQVLRHRLRRPARL
jgi:hypothetical protein